MRNRVSGYINEYKKNILKKGVAYKDSKGVQYVKLSGTVVKVPSWMDLEKFREEEKNK